MQPEDPSYCLISPRKKTKTSMTVNTLQCMEVTLILSSLCGYILIIT